MVFPDYYLIDESGNITDIIRHNFDNVSLMDKPAHGACTMLRTESLRDIGGYDESFSRQDGYELWIRFIQHYKVKNVNLPLFYYRQHSKSLTKNEIKIFETRAKILQKRATDIKTKNNLAIIPIRGEPVEKNSFALKKLGNKNLVNWTIDTILLSKNINNIIITTR